MELGWCDICLNIKDLKASRTFYEKLGFKIAEGNKEDKYFVMYNQKARIGLYEGHFEGFMINFRGGDVKANVKTLQDNGLSLTSDLKETEDGSIAATLYDPDGNMIFLNTYPVEKDEAHQKKIGVI